MLRDHSCVIVLNDKTRMMSNPVTEQKDLLTIIYALTTVKGASVK
jgi:hypothetical protein